MTTANIMDDAAIKARPAARPGKTLKRGEMMLTVEYFDDDGGGDQAEAGIRRQYVVASPAEASRVWLAVHDGLMRAGYYTGASRFSPTTLMDAKRKVVAYVSYNGRVWAGKPNDWTPKTEPIYEPR